MEGISAEAVSLAGTLGLGKLILLYDSNGITIEGPTEIAFREDTRARFEACGWHTILVEDGEDISALTGAIEAAKKMGDRPSLIEVKTIIGRGSPKQGTAAVHGTPLSEDEIAQTKNSLGWEYAEPFFVPREVYSEIDKWQERMQSKENEWNALVSRYAAAFPEDFAEWEKWRANLTLEDFEKAEDFWKYEGNLATRVSSEQVLQKIWKLSPNLFGGSADLAPSNNSLMKGRGDFSKETPDGSNLHFGVREHAMTAIANAIAAHGGLRPYVAGFFVFCDYMKPAMRLSAMMGLPVVYIMTHDSIGVGEDGPTHEPVEQLAALRSVPNFTVIRPCDTNETAAAWAMALTRVNSPTALVLSRQNLTLLKETGRGAYRGAYVLKERTDPQTNMPDAILMASGSETELIYKAHDVLFDEYGIKTRVVSFPSFEVFEEQDDAYKKSVFPTEVRARVAVEAASGFGWHKYAGLDGAIISIDGFGASAPAGKLFAEYGITVEKIVEKTVGLVKNG